MNILNKLLNIYKRAYRYINKVHVKNAVIEISKRYILSRHDIRMAKKFLLRSSSDLSDDEKKIVKTVSDKIHFLDGMYIYGNALAYFNTGLLAIRCVENAIQPIKNAIHINRVLDFPSGYGRVLRFLREKFPRASFTACDIDPNAVQFCEREFLATSVISKVDFNHLILDDKFDLIWCGSLITHIDKQSTLSLLKFFKRQLSENGLCLFTTHGYKSVAEMQKEPYSIGLALDSINKLIKQFFDKGYGYIDYPNNKGYGISAISPVYIREILDLVGLKEVYYQAHGWGNQDVYGCILLS